MRVKAMVSFGTADGLTYQSGLKYDVADEQAQAFINAGHMRQVLSPAAEFITYARDHKFALEFDAQTDKATVADMKAEAKSVDGVKVHELESMVIICNADKKVSGKKAKSVAERAEKVEDAKPAVGKPKK